MVQHFQGKLQSAAFGLEQEHMHPELIPQEAEAYGHERRAIYLLPFQQQTERPE